MNTEILQIINQLFMNDLISTNEKTYTALFAVFVAGSLISVMIALVMTWHRWTYFFIFISFALIVYYTAAQHDAKFKTIKDNPAAIAKIACDKGVDKFNFNYAFAELSMYEKGLLENYLHSLGSNEYEQKAALFSNACAAIIK